MMCTVEDSQCVNIGCCSPILSARPVNGQILHNMAKNGCFLAITLFPFIETWTSMLNIQ